MYIITTGDKEHQLSTALGTVKKIEQRSKLPMSETMAKLGEANVDELIKIILCAADKSDTTLENDIIENWDYFELQLAVQELMAQMLFSGTPEQQEAKVEKYPIGEREKNGIRLVLGLPEKPLPSLAEDGGSNVLPMHGK